MVLKLTKNEKERKTKEYIYASSSLLGTIFAIMFRTILVGYIIGLASFVYAIIALRLSLKNKDNASLIKSVLAIIFLVTCLVIEPIFNNGN